MKHRKLINMKSHDNHILMQDILLVALRASNATKVIDLIEELSCFFKKICSTSIDTKELDDIQSKLVLTPCKMEQEFLPTFFTIMVHVLIHLVDEVRLGGPVHYRWMYPVERFINMSYRSKRTRAATASDAEANGRWGPFNPPNIINTQDLPSSSTTNTSTQPPPQKRNPIWKKPINVPTPPSITNTQDLPSSYTTTQPLPQKSNHNRKKQHDVPNSPSITNTQGLLSSSTTNTSAHPPPQKNNPILDKALNATFHPSITNTHGFPSSSTQNTSNIPPKFPPSKLSKPPKFPSTSHTSHQPWEEEMQGAPTEYSPIENKDKQKHACDETTKEKSKIFKLRRRALLPEWLSTIDYDDKEEVLTIDADGKKQLVSGHVPLIEVWNNNNGVKYVVNFNELCQPIRKGGHILVQFLRSIAKEERYCPLLEKTWHELDQSFKAYISKLIRDLFVIPNEEKYYTQALQRVDKVWRG
ncbi:uncharacterized protein LOC110721241 [Chenopodium quinoa]|uniref:uncharacterized protein LOC110721241 n=1 Tax=Chenopodium quinoa TaxID=63459 RepID=UPI000B78F920|nr:uncharacterized protein LOC110721241 [Chenopodium quinoa]